MSFSPRATVTPDNLFSSILSGSSTENARPIRLETGASVMYLLFNLTRITVVPVSVLQIRPVSIWPVASEPLFGPVKPKQGIRSPNASCGR